MSTNKVLCVVVNSGLYLSPAMNAKEVPVGTELELTQRQFEAFTGKVRLKDTQELSKAAVSGELMVSYEKRIGELESTVASFEAEVKRLRGDNLKLTEELDKANDIITNLEAEVGN